ncbi:MAG: CsbD family protein [Candidatus Limnocylindria bacterium]
MDKDRPAGAVKKAGGKVKEVLGKVVGDKSIEGKGKRDQVEGSLQEGWGKTKDAVRDLGKRGR